MEPQDSEQPWTTRIDRTLWHENTELLPVMFGGTYRSGRSVLRSGNSVFEGIVGLVAALSFLAGAPLWTSYREKRLHNVFQSSRALAGNVTSIGASSAVGDIVHISVADFHSIASDEDFSVHISGALNIQRLA